jgi:hypothetical protein
MARLVRALSVMHAGYVIAHIVQVQSLKYQDFNK